MYKTNNDRVEEKSGPGAGLAEPSLGSQEELEEAPKRKHTRRKHRARASNMELNTTIAEVHRSAPARVHSAARRNRSQSRHDHHKCHKHKFKSEENDLINQVSQLRNENYLLNRRLNTSASSLDSGLPFTEALPAIDIDLKKAFQHLKQENTQLMEDIKICRVENEKLKTIAETELKESSLLKEDIVMLKNLVYRLNIELEKFQEFRDKVKSDEGQKKDFDLPKYYNKNFLKPILPLLKAYSETIQEKNELIQFSERNLERFNLSFNELLKENETLYKELEAKLTREDDNVLDDVKFLKDELKTCKEEKELYQRQAKLEAAKLKEIEAVYQTRVSLLEREKDVALDKLQEARADIYTLRGKHSVVKQELDRLRCEDDSKVPLLVHSASIGECKRLLQDLKNAHECEKQDLTHKLREAELKLKRKEEEMSKELEDKLTLEQGNFDLAFDCDNMKRRVAELENRQQFIPSGDNPHAERDPTLDEELQNMKRQLRDSMKKISELEGKLIKSKKRLQQSMAFAEDLVKEQESLLSQLHEKQNENTAMVSQFGSLKKKLKIVEKGAQAGLDSVEERMKSLETENQELHNQVNYLKTELHNRERMEAALDTEETSS